MLRRIRVLTMGLALTSTSSPAYAQSQAELQALGTAYAVYVGAGYLKDGCVKRDPASAAKVNQAYAAWIKAQNLGNFEAQLGQKLGQEALTQLRQNLSAGLSTLNAALQKLGPPSQACPALASQFSSDTFNIRKQVPNLTALLGTAATASSGGASSGGGSVSGSSSAASKVTLYTVAQLSTLLAQTIAPLPRNQQDEAGLKKLKSLGTVMAVSGTKQRSRSITQEDDRRETKYDVYCYDMADDADNPPPGQVTVAGRVRDFDASTGITLESCVVLNAGLTAQLKKSTLPVADGGWRFKAQPAEKFLVAAGQGLKDSEILGVYMEQSYSVGVGGMTIMTFPVSLFLKDGTVYNDPHWAPNSFNYKLSRQLEPLKWGKWTKKGNNFVITWGNSKTETFEVKGAPKPLSAGTKLSGAFQTISGGGNTALGGDVMVAGGNTYTFRPDGTYGGDSFGSGSSGGGTSGHTGVVVSSQSKQGGTYNVSGYGITLKSAGGQERRLFFARYNQDLLYIGGSPYTPDR